MVQVAMEINKIQTRIRINSSKLNKMTKENRISRLKEMHQMIKQKHKAIMVISRIITNKHSQEAILVDRLKLMISKKQVHKQIQVETSLKPHQIKIQQMRKNHLLSKL